MVSVHCRSAYRYFCLRDLPQNESSYLREHDVKKWGMHSIKFVTRPRDQSSLTMQGIVTHHPSQKLLRLLAR